MASPFIVADYKPNDTKGTALKSESFYISRKIVKKAVITGYEDEAKTQPVGVLVPDVVEEKQDIQELINQDVKNCGVANIIKRIVKTGDMSLLNQKDPIYTDLSNLPQSDAEVKATARKMESLYDKVPDDLKKNLSVAEFLSQIDENKVLQYFTQKAKNAQEVKGNE